MQEADEQRHQAAQQAHQSHQHRTIILEELDGNVQRVRRLEEQIKLFTERQRIQWLLKKEQKRHLCILEEQRKVEWRRRMQEGNVKELIGYLDDLGSFEEIVLERAMTTLEERENEERRYETRLHCEIREKAIRDRPFLSSPERRQLVQQQREEAPAAQQPAQQQDSVETNSANSRYTVSLTKDGPVIIDHTQRLIMYLTRRQRGGIWTLSQNPKSSSDITFLVHEAGEDPSTQQQRQEPEAQAICQQAEETRQPMEAPWPAPAIEPGQVVYGPEPFLEVHGVAQGKCKNLLSFF